MTPQTTPLRLNLKKDEMLEIDWQDGRRCVYTLALLRALCPCAQCKVVREGASADPKPPTEKKKPVLNILPGNYAKPLSAVSAELVGNYALRIDWSDDHGSGIYSFQYLREICPDAAGSGEVGSDGVVK
jgi:DUF971 family protein